MSGRFFLDWAVMGVSLFNTILLLWLALTVLLNAEQRTGVIWLASGGLGLGGFFFLIHSAILIQGLSYVSWGMDFWWHIGWIPIIALPISWYGMMLWYAGLWRQQRFPVNRRHRIGLFLTALLAAGLIALFLAAIPLPSLWQVTQLDLSAAPSVGGLGLLFLVYPFYTVLSISLALDALRRPGPSDRIMGDLARHRARPWLVSASVALLLASLLVSALVLWTIRSAAVYPATGSVAVLLPTVAWFDLTIATFIGMATTALGQAIVSYEVFTGKTIPRGGLRRYWRNAIILAVGYGVALGWSLSHQYHALYSVLISILLITFFFALLSWRSYAERERYFAHLRPFVTSQRLYEHVVTTSNPQLVDAKAPFYALCDDVLGARVAYLVSVGPLAALAGPPLKYPNGLTDTLPSLTKVVDSLASPQTAYIALDAGQYCGASWALPLWSERGLIGVLLLGNKRDGGLYTREELEIARASGERLIDTQASAEMARRLMALQRQRMAEGQVIDRRARRTLHDEILPQLHAAMLMHNGRDEQDLKILADLHRQLSDLLRDMPATTAPKLDRLGLLGALREVVEDEFANAFDKVRWQIEPEAEKQLDVLPRLTAEVLFYATREAVRNAAYHGRDGGEEQPLHLGLSMRLRNGLEIVIEDSGIGTGVLQGPDRDQSAAGGHGLALHSTMMAVIGGALIVESEQGEFTRVTLAVPESRYQPETVG
jgi:signal transduction histidine kinase